MANTASAKKRVRSSERRQLRNKAHRSRAKTYLQKTLDLLARGDLQGATQMARQATSTLDRAAEKGVIHPNTAARRKARLMKKLNAAAAAQGPQR